MLLDSRLKKIETIASRDKIAFHGVNNSLNNILGWLRLKGSFGLFDNDKSKIGKMYFGKIVQSPTKDKIKDYSTIFIVPYAFFKEIKKQYEHMEFKGNIEGVVNNK